jgi:hypothetical protein
MATTAAAVRKVTLCVTADTVISSHSPEHRPHGVFPPDLPSDYAEGPNKQQQQDQHQHHQHQQSNEEAAAWSSWSSAVGIDGVLCAMVNAELLIQVLMSALLPSSSSRFNRLTPYFLPPNQLLV